MQEIWLVLYIGIIFLLGHCVVSIVRGGNTKSVAEILGLGFAAGSGCMGVLLFWISLAGFRPTRAVILSIGVAATALLAFLWNRKRLPSPACYIPNRSSDLLLLIPAVVIGTALFSVCVHALAFPVYEVDAVAIWGLKAKVLALESLGSGPAYFRDLSFSYSHLGYPLLLPFLMAGAYGITGGIDDQAAKIIFPLLYLNLGVVIYWGLRWKLPRIQSAFLTSVFMGIPVLVRHAGSGGADSVLTLFYAAAALFTVKWLEEEKRPDLFMAALFVVFCAHTKNEGMAIALIVAAILLIFSLGRSRKEKLLGLFLFVVIVSVLLFPWLWWAKDIPRTDENYVSRISPEIVVDNIHRVTIIIPALLRETAKWDRWGALWLLVVAMSILGAKAFRKRRVAIIWLLFLAHVGAYQFIYVITAYNVIALMTVTLNRLLLHVAPVAIFIIGYHWSEITAGRPNGRDE